MIMKKIYLQPETLVEGMELEEMVASTLTDGQDLSNASETEATEGNLARQILFLEVFE